MSGFKDHTLKYKHHLEIVLPILDRVPNKFLFFLHCAHAFVNKVHSCYVLKEEATTPLYYLENPGVAPTKRKE